MTVYVQRCIKLSCNSFVEFNLVGCFSLTLTPEMFPVKYLFYFHFCVAVFKHICNFAQEARVGGGGIHFCFPELVVSVRNRMITVGFSDTKKTVLRFLSLGSSRE